jgi:hypothetical protein
MRRLIALALVVSTLGAVQASAAEYVYRAWCPITKVEGIGKGASAGEARDAAYYACVGKGGLPKCCTKYYQQLSPQ